MYHYAGNNPVKYTDPDGREDDDFDNNKGFSLTELDLTDNKIQKDSEFNRYQTPSALSALDRFATYTSSSVGISVAKRTADLEKATAPITNEYGTIIAFRSPDSVYAKECEVALKNVRNISNALFIIGIGIGVADSIYCGVSQHSLETGIKRAVRYTSVVLSSTLACSICSSAGPWTGAAAGLITGKVVDGIFESKGW